jgi:hypothetical protein
LPQPVTCRVVPAGDRAAARPARPRRQWHRGSPPRGWGRSPSVLPAPP